jgi:hypothetical protein
MSFQPCDKHSDYYSECLVCELEKLKEWNSNLCLLLSRYESKIVELEEALQIRKNNYRCPICKGDLCEEGHKNYCEYYEVEL